MHTTVGANMLEGGWVREAVTTMTACSCFIVSMYVGVLLSCGFTSLCLIELFAVLTHPDCVSHLHFFAPPSFLSHSLSLCLSLSFYDMPCGLWLLAHDELKDAEVDTAAAQSLLPFSIQHMPMLWGGEAACSMSPRPEAARPPAHTQELSYTYVY